MLISPKASGLFSAAIMESIPTPRMLIVSIVKAKQKLTGLQPHTTSTSLWKRRSKLRQTQFSTQRAARMALPTHRSLASAHSAPMSSRVRVASRTMS